MNGHDEGREEKPYFKLSKNEHGTMWLLYNPSDDSRYNCWEPINEKFWTEFESLLNDREQLAKERQLRKELVEALNFIEPRYSYFNKRVSDEAISKLMKALSNNKGT